MNPGDLYFLLLYLISIFQPVTRKDLLREAAKTSGISSTDLANTRLMLEALKELARRELIVESGGTISCTVLGDQRAAQLGLRRVRDKNRLFFLKNLIRREYNEDR